jgi:hypothetical protein
VGRLPPEQGSPPSTAAFHYRTRLRVSNTGATNTTITVVITQSGTSTTKTFTVPFTGNTHEYVVVDDPTGYSLPLLSGTSFSFTCTTGSGPFAIYDIVFESARN